MVIETFIAIADELKRSKPYYHIYLIDANVVHGETTDDIDKINS